MSAALLVADSGPLIALARLNLLALPSQLFAEVLVTATVWQEVTREPQPLEGERFEAALHNRVFTVLADPAQWPGDLPEVNLDAGERSAIALAHERSATILVDERRGRSVAATLGLHVLGTLGLLVRARDAGLVEKVRPLTEALRVSGYFLAQPLVDRTLAAIGE